MKKLVLLLLCSLMSLTGIAQRRTPVQSTPAEQKAPSSEAYKSPKVKGLYPFSVDVFNKTTFYSRGGSVYDGGFDLYIQCTDGRKPNLYARIGYNGHDWCFFTKAFFKYTYKGISYAKELIISRRDKQTKVTSSQYTGVSCIEYADILIDDELFDYFYDMTTTEDAMMRVEGDLYKNITFKSKSLEGKRIIMDIYKNLVQVFNDNPR